MTNLADDRPLSPVEERLTAKALDALRDDELVLEFVKGRNVYCPVCAYNLRDATVPTCPECAAELKLSLYGAATGRPWAYSIALIGLVFGMIASAIACIAGLAPVLRLPALLGGVSMGLTSFVLIWLIETRFWQYWGKYAQHRTTLVVMCWAPFVIAGAGAAHAILL